MKRILGVCLGIFVVGCGNGGGTQSQTPEYTTDIAPILAENCVGCHQDGSIAPFQLESYEQVQAVGPVLKNAVVSRIMPPFLVDNTGECNTWKDAMWLTDKEISTIAKWVDAGMPEGPEMAPPEPKQLPSLDEVDVTLQLPEPYTPNTELTDDYRCFIVDPGLTEDMYVIGHETIPGAPEIVHHMILYEPVDDQAAADAVALDEADPGPGYQCFGSPGVDSLHVAGWAPGALASYFPEGRGVRFPAGRKMVMQVHYNLLAGSEPDQTLVNLDLAPSVTEELLVVPLADTGMQLQAGQDSVSTTIQIPLPNEVPKLPVYGVFPHMHTLGQTLTVERTRNGETECMVDVPRWDFDWQFAYEYQEPMDVQGGDILTLTCGYDTSSRNEDVYWGDGTQDEMCLNYITLGVPPGLIP